MASEWISLKSYANLMRKSEGIPFADLDGAEIDALKFYSEPEWALKK